MDMDRPAAAERVSVGRPKPVALITGASSGIGAALAHVFAQNGHEVVLAARRVPQLAAIADEHPRRRAPHAAHPAGRSRRAPTAPSGSRANWPRAISNPRSWSTMRATACSARRTTLDRADQLAMIDLNCRSLTDLSLRFIDSLARHRGGILNVASISGFIPGPGMSVYNASKAYVISFSVGLRRELKPEGHPRHRALPRPGADRIPGARRHHGRALSARLRPHGRGRRAAGLQGADARARASWCRACTTSWCRGCRASCRAASSPPWSMAACGAGKTCRPVLSAHSRVSGNPKSFEFAGSPPSRGRAE